MKDSEWECNLTFESRACCLLGWVLDNSCDIPIPTYVWRSTPIAKILVVFFYYPSRKRIFLSTLGFFKTIVISSFSFHSKYKSNSSLIQPKQFLTMEKRKFAQRSSWRWREWESWNLCNQDSLFNPEKEWRINTERRCELLDLPLQRFN